jgi:hypothetical protein
MEVAVLFTCEILVRIGEGKVIIAVRLSGYCGGNPPDPEGRISIGPADPEG